MPALLRDRHALERRVERLTCELARHPADGRTVGALAECCFRLALHPDTPVDSALELLKAAARHDASNPAYAYHLGLLYLRHGHTRPGGSWLARAQRLCPTSHRVWCHISQLQLELNAAYVGDGRFVPGGLKDRADQVRGAILRGEDVLDPALLDVEPPPRRQDGDDAAPATVRRGHGARDDRDGTGEPGPSAHVSRRTDAGRCRWSGVLDLRLEHLLETPPTRKTMRDAQPLLEQIAADAARREGGTTAFVIAAAQWLVVGYPVETVRRLMAKLPATGAEPALRLLDQLCSLCEALPAELPLLLADRLSAGAVPTLTAAVLHRRLVLGPSPEFKGTGAHRDASALLRRAGIDQGPEPDETAQQADIHIAALQRALDAFVAPRGTPRLTEVVDSEGGSGEPADAAADLATLEEHAQVLEAARLRAWDHLMKVLVPRSMELTDAAACAQVAADSEALKEVKLRLENAAAAGKKRLALVVAALAASAAPPPDLPGRDQVIKNAYGKLENLGPFTRQLGPVEARLAKAAQPSPAQHPSPDDKREPHPDLAGLLAELPVGEASSREAPGAGTEPVRRYRGLDGLRQMLTEVEQTIDRCFLDRLATFQPYPPDLRASPPMRRLVAELRSRHAQTLFHLGRPRAARQLWNDMALADRLELSALRNIAVCDSRIGDLAESMASWRSLVETLYYHDIVMGTARPHAAERAEFHRILADSLGPRFLLQPLNGKALERLDQHELLTFLDSPPRVAGYVANKLLQLLNERLALTSPMLTLGTAKSDSEQSRTDGAEALDALVESLRPELPPRIADAFCSLAGNRLRQCVAQSSAATWLSGRQDLDYLPERESVVASLSSFLESKYWFAAAVPRLQGELVLPRLEAVQLLSRLDDFPLAHSSDLATTPAGRIGQRDADAAQSLITTGTCKPLVSITVDSIFRDPENPDLRSRQDRCYQAILTRRQDPLFADLSSIIDDPQPYYPSTVMTALRSKGDSNRDVRQAAIQELGHWSERFPQSTGPARWRALLLTREGRLDEAITVLDRARAAGVDPAGTMACLATRMDVHCAMAHACSERHDREGVISALRRACSDAERVASESGDPDERERAENLRAQALDTLHAAGAEPA
jgi:hypothetical protein